MSMSSADHLQKYPFDLTPQLTDAAGLNGMWEVHDAYVYQSASPPTDIPGFYPLYRHDNYYSFSILPLILQKGTFCLNQEFEDRYLGGASDVAGPDMTIDREITRIGAPKILDQSISDRQLFVSMVAEAMQKDVRRICALNPGKTNFVLCGGKDSLNILLLDWDAPIVALSAQPNFPLVQKFVEENGLDMEVRLLEDIDPGPGMLREVAEAACLVDLSHWKWAEHLRRISQECGYQAIFWKGQMADATLTDYWRSYTSNSNQIYKYMRKAYQKLARKAPNLLDALFSRHVIADVQHSLWQRGGVGQGSHVGFLRAICNALVLSVYHGSETAEVMRRIDLRKLTVTDLRPEIGEALLGRPVRYPLENPAPPSSDMRKGLRTVPEFKRSLRSFGVEVA